MAESPAKTTNLSSRLPSGTSGTPLTSWTLEEKRGVVRNPQYTPLDLRYRSLSPLHSPWAPALPAVLTSQTGPGGNETDNTLPRAWLPTEPPFPPCPLSSQTYPGSLLSTSSRKTRKSQGPLVEMEKEKLRHEKREGPKKGQRRSGEVMEAVVWETWALPITR